MFRLWKALSYWFRSLFGKTTALISDPVRDSQFQIEDAEKERDRFENRIAKLLANNRKIERELNQEVGQVSKWDIIIKKAVAANNRDDARKALVNKTSAESRVNVLKVQLTESRAEAEKLKDDLEHFNIKIENAKRSSTMLAARLEGAQIRSAITSGGSDINSAFAALDNLEKMANEAVDMAEAHTELSSSPFGLIEKYDSTDDAIEAKLNLLLPAPVMEK